MGYLSRIHTSLFCLVSKSFLCFHLSRTIGQYERRVAGPDSRVPPPFTFLFHAYTCMMRVDTLRYLSIHRSFGFISSNCSLVQRYPFFKPSFYLICSGMKRHLIDILDHPFPCGSYFMAR